MIGYLRGRVLDASEGRILVAIDAQGQGAVGYQVSVPSSPSYLGFSAGASAELFVHTHVREDALDLFGFASRMEKDLFLLLLTVNGIGPKLALSLLSKVPAEELVQIVITGDKDALTAFPGVGKKTAERVVLELSDVLRKKVESGAFASLRAGSVRAASDSELPAGALAVFRDAREALVGLGYREAEASAALKKVLADNQKPGIEDTIRLALKQLG